jgi:Tfp pilus assembly protein PilF
LVQGDQEEADRLLEQAIAIYSAIGARYHVAAQTGNYGWALLRVGKPDRARPYLLRAAQLFAEMGLDDYAERHLQAAGVPTDPREMRILLEQALPVLRQGGDQTQLSQALTMLRELAHQGEDWRTVLSTCEELIALGAGDADTWAALGDARSNLGDEAAAAEAYAQAVALAPEQAMLRRNYAHALINLGRLDEAAAQIDAAEK